MAKKTYAVVDLESTGTNDTTDRIIQIGIALVEHGEIVSTFSTDINPGMPISPIIQELTGITNAQVEKAPYFEDVAETIYSLLQGTIFVAHNIHFDFRFLNSEFVRVGLKPMENRGIDTVELAQIFFPTLESYKLSNLSQTFGFLHENPHQADSDAYVTAKLLIAIEEKVRTIPIQTLQQIAALSDALAFDNQLFIKNRLQERILSLGETLPPTHVEIGRVVLRKQSDVKEKPYKPLCSYPETKRQKEAFFSDAFQVRKTQAKYMNTIQAHLKSEKKELFLQASTGVGKTIGYLFPLAFSSTPEKKTVISTSSITLQEQLVEEEIPKFNALLPFQLQATLVKSSRHFINLERFHETLKKSVEQKQYKIYQMATLVWLLETETGDLSELNQTSYQHLFFDHVKHRGTLFLCQESPFYEVDFYRKKQQEIANCSILVVNHAYLVNESLRLQKTFSNCETLVVDEAHMIPQAFFSLSSRRVKVSQIRRVMKQLTNEDGFLLQGVDTFRKGQKSFFSRQIKLIKYAIEEFLPTFTKFETTLLQQFPRDKEEVEIKEEERSRNATENYRFQQKINEILMISQQFVETCEEWKLNLSPEQKIFVEKLMDFNAQMKRMQQFFEVYFSEKKSVVTWGSATKTRELLVLHLQDFENLSIAKNDWYGEFSKAIFTSGTLEVGKEEGFIPRQLGFDDKSVQKITSPYDYSKQGRLFVVNDVAYQNSKLLKEALCKILEVVEESTLILFSSKENLTDIYRKLSNEELFLTRELLAQDITGTKEKMLKRFKTSKGSVLLGLDTYWDGVDLPGDSLKMIIATKLPFDNPKQEGVKQYYEYLKEKKLEPFQNYSLPKTCVRLQQGFGRLLRSDEDRGVMILLDQRMQSKSYGKQILRSFPKELPKIIGSLEECIEQTKDFLV